MTGKCETCAHWQRRQNDEEEIVGRCHGGDGIVGMETRLCRAPVPAPFAGRPMASDQHCDAWAAPEGASLAPGE